MLISGKLYRLDSNNPTTRESYFILRKVDFGYKVSQERKHIKLDIKSIFMFLHKANVEYDNNFIQYSPVFLLNNSLFAMSNPIVKQC